jgi:hypothetical protein
MNEFATVKLTPRGLGIYKKYYGNFPEKISANNEIELQLWEMFLVFGETFFVGCDVPFEDNLITIESEKNETT